MIRHPLYYFYLTNLNMAEAEIFCSKIAIYEQNLTGLFFVCRITRTLEVAVGLLKK